MNDLTMFDSVNPVNIPSGAKMVAGYVNGLWPDYATLVKQHPHAHHVSITVNAETLADVLDVEKGDATPSQALPWVAKMRESGHTPIIYTSRSNFPNVQQVFLGANVPEPFYWIADWTNVAHLVPGSIATQWADGSESYPGLAKFCDTSLVSPNWPGLFVPPHHLTTAIKKGSTKMTLSLPTLKSWVRQLGSVAGIVISLGNQAHLPLNVRAILLAGSVWIQKAQHDVDVLAAQAEATVAKATKTPGA